MRLATVQMTSSQDVEQNLDFVDKAVRDAINMGAEMLFLPENFAALASPNLACIASLESVSTGPIRSFLSHQAKDNKLWIVAGTLPTSARPDGAMVPDGRIRAACFVYDATGKEIARYDKIHMFDVIVADNQGTYQESERYEPGDHLATVDTPAGRIGLSVCYDIRFPELYRSLLLQGAELLSIPSAFTRPTGQVHWQTLARARAIENCSYVVCACQWGQHDSGRATWGESLVIDPLGDVLAVHSPGTGVLVADISIERLHEVRQNMPIHNQVRLSISPPIQVD